MMDVHLRWHQSTFAYPLAGTTDTGPYAADCDASVRNPLNASSLAMLRVAVALLHTPHASFSAGAGTPRPSLECR